MKRRALLLSLLALSSTAHAQTEWIARSRNDAGGEIVLLANRASCPAGSLRMFAAASGGSVIWGCFRISSTHVHVVYDNGLTRAYDFNGWTFNPMLGELAPAQPQRGPSL